MKNLHLGRPKAVSRAVDGLLILCFSFYGSDFFYRKVVCIQLCSSFNRMASPFMKEKRADFCRPSLLTVDPHAVPEGPLIHKEQDLGGGGSVDRSTRRKRESPRL